MFWVINKDKIYSYAVTLSVIGVLFAISAVMVPQTQTENSVETSNNATSKLLPIYNVETKENKVAFTINCAWNADDIDSILKTLEENNIKLTFFMVGDWIDKFPEAAKKISDAGHEIRKQ